MGLLTQLCLIILEHIKTFFFKCNVCKLNISRRLVTYLDLPLASHSILELYHVKNNAVENNQKIKVFITVETCSLFLNYDSSTSLDITLNVSSSERRRVIPLMESVKFLLAALFANARRVDVSKSRVENEAILRLRPRNLFSRK